MLLQPTLLAFAAVFRVAGFLAAQYYITFAVQFDIFEPAFLVFANLPTVFGHTPVFMLVAAEESAQFLAVRLLTLNHAAIGRYIVFLRRFCRLCGLLRSRAENHHSHHGYQ